MPGEWVSYVEFYKMEELIVILTGVPSLLRRKYPEGVVSICYVRYLRP